MAEDWTKNTDMGRVDGLELLIKESFHLEIWIHMSSVIGSSVWQIA